MVSSHMYRLCLSILWCIIICGADNINVYIPVITSQHNMFRKTEYATNMLRMSYDTGLAREAAQWVNNCRFKHEESGFGENLYYDTYNSSIQTFILDGLNTWYKERKNWQLSKGNCGSACHYTQMVWANTSLVGCAVNHCDTLQADGRSIKDARYMACYYYPKGNMYGSYPFEIGPLCSWCSKDSHCKDGMCETTVPILKTTQVTIPVIKEITRHITTKVTTTPSPTAHSQCTDRLRGCIYWKRDCATNKAVRIACTKTCERCNPPAFIQFKPSVSVCVDDSKYKTTCPAWAEKGYCSKNQLMRDVYCKKTCKTCI